MPVVIVGVRDGEKENYSVVAHVGIMNFGEPQFITIGLHKSHHSIDCIKRSEGFSVCIPSEDLVLATDYVGLASGKSVDKSRVFKAFYSEERNAPMVEGCPVCMDCRVHDVLDFKTHDVFVGEILATYAEDSVLTDGHIDIAKARPMLFEMGSKHYWSIGQPIARCWDVGKAYTPE